MKEIFKVNMKLIIQCFILGTFLNFSSLIPTKEDIDSSCNDIREALIYQEERIALVLKKYSTQIQNCSQELKSSSQSKDLTMAMDNFKDLINQLQTIKNFVPYVEISTCGDINYKFTMLDFEQQEMNFVLSSINKNISMVYRLQSDVVRNYQLNLNQLRYLSPIERKVFDIIQGLSTRVLPEYWNYVRILSLNIAKIAGINAMMSAFKKYYCPCLANVDWTGYNSTLEKNVQVRRKIILKWQQNNKILLNFKVVEDRLSQTLSNIKNLSSTALSSVRTSISSLPSSSTALITSLQLVQSTLTSISADANYTKTSWPSVESCDDYLNRIKFLRLKVLQYSGILSSTNLNSLLLTAYQTRVNSTILNSLTSQQLKNIQNAITAVTKVTNMQSTYRTLLIYGITRIARMIGDFGYLGGTFCTCEESVTSSETVTTTSKTFESFSF